MLQRQDVVAQDVADVVQAVTDRVLVLLHGQGSPLYIAAVVYEGHGRIEETGLVFRIVVADGGQDRRGKFLHGAVVAVGQEDAVDAQRIIGLVQVVRCQMEIAGKQGFAEAEAELAFAVMDGADPDEIAVRHGPQRYRQDGLYQLIWRSILEVRCRMDVDEAVFVAQQRIVRAQQAMLAAQLFHFCVFTDFQVLPASEIEDDDIRLQAGVQLCLQLFLLRVLFGQVDDIRQEGFKFIEIIEQIASVVYVDDDVFEI